MKTIKQLSIQYRELLSYIVFGVLTTIVNLAVFQLLNATLGNEQYLLSNIGAWIGAVVFAYITNKLWVFQSKSWKSSVIIKEITGFFSARVASFLIEEFGLFILVDIMDFKSLEWGLAGISISGEMVAKIILAVIVVIINYVFSKVFIFKK